MPTPIEQIWYFTLAASQGGPGCITVTAPSREHARIKMFEHFGNTWAFQYESLEEVHPLDRKILNSI